MIKIIYTDKSIAITGHAQSNKKGKDLVCAAISGIYLGALSWFKDKEIELKQLNDGTKLTLVNSSKSNRDKIDLLVKQLKTIASENPECIKITKGK